MEKNDEVIVAMQNAIEEPPKTMNNVGNEEANEQEKKKKKKKRGAMHLFRVAMLMLHGQSVKSKAIDVGSKGKWKQVVGSMRPLHLQNDQSPKQFVRGGGVPAPPCPTIELYEDGFLSPFSPGASSSSSHTVDDSMSRYASAMNLQELDHNHDHSDNENEEIGGDKMIDEKAEMFIAQFYEQAKLQQLESIQ